MSESQTIQIELSVDDTNKILEALGALPFSDVYQIIGSIQRQAQAQLQPPEGAGEGGEAGDGDAGGTSENAQ